MCLSINGSWLNAQGSRLMAKRARPAPGLGDAIINKSMIHRLLKKKLLNLLSGSGLCGSLAKYLTDPLWASVAIYSMVIESLMWDETSHTIRIPSSVPQWMLNVRAKLKLTDSISELSTGADDNNALPKKRKTPMTSTTSSVLVIRRRLYWVTQQGFLRFIPLACAPVAMKSKHAQVLWSALFSFGQNGIMAYAINKLFEKAKLGVRIRTRDNNLLNPHQMSLMDLIFYYSM